MENYINEAIPLNINGEESEMSNVLISTIYEYNSVMLCITKFSIERVYLIVDKEPDEKQKKAVELVRSALGQVVEIKEKKCSVYEIVDVAERVAELIDDLPNTDNIYINTTAGRKTQSLGLIYGCYARVGRVKELVYVTEEEKKLIYLPKLSFDISESQREMLELVSKKAVKSVMEISTSSELSRAIVYRNFETLKNRGLLRQTDDGSIDITDFGKLVLL